MFKLTTKVSQPYLHCPCGLHCLWARCCACTALASKSARWSSSRSHSTEEARRCGSGFPTTGARTTMFKDSWEVLAWSFLGCSSAANRTLRAIWLGSLDRLLDGSRRYWWKRKSFHVFVLDVVSWLPLQEHLESRLSLQNCFVTWALCRLPLVRISSLPCRRRTMKTSWYCLQEKMNP